MALQQIKETMASMADHISDEVANLNYGGCGLFTYFVGVQLQKIGVPYKIKVVSHDDTCVNSVRPFLKENTLHEFDANGLVIGHVILEIDGSYYDSTGFIDPLDAALKGDGEVVQGCLTLEELEGMVMEVDGWNPDFDRDDIPTLQALVETYLDPEWVKFTEENA